MQVFTVNHMALSCQIILFVSSLDSMKQFRVSTIILSFHVILHFLKNIFLLLNNFLLIKILPFFCYFLFVYEIYLFTCWGQPGRDFFPNSRAFSFLLLLGSHEISVTCLMVLQFSLTLTVFPAVRLTSVLTNFKTALSSFPLVCTPEVAPGRGLDERSWWQAALFPVRHFFPAGEKPLISTLL